MHLHMGLHGKALRCDQTNVAQAQASNLGYGLWAKPHDSGARGLCPGYQAPGLAMGAGPHYNCKLKHCFSGMFF